MKFAFLIFSSVLMISVCARGEWKEFGAIEASAQVGNGHTSRSDYNTELDRKTLVANAQGELENEYRTNCGPWKKINTRRSAIAEIRKLELEEDESPTGNALEELYKKKKIVAIVGALSNGDVSCSLSWFNIYGSEGEVLRLRYDHGD